jgi:16S rRNA (cytosine967-C5)-methyltransferase
MREAQVAATRVLQRVLTGTNLEQALEVGRAGIAHAHERALTQDISFGVLRHLGLLDAQIARLLDKPLQQEAVRQLLRAALYQLQFTRAAPHAVVDHAVSACAALQAPRAKALVNAVLRGYLRRKHELAGPPDDAARYSFAPWWIAKLRRQYPTHWRDMLHAGNQHPPLTLRVNARRTTQAAYLERLGGQGIGARAVGAQGVILDKALPARDIPGLAAGEVSVQDAGAQWAAALLDVKPAMRVLDACAAPGGKSTHLLELADIELTALDSDAARLSRVTENLQRLSFQARVLHGDAARPQDWWDGKPYERILADVPCSASGVTRRHPDIKWTRRESDIVKFATTQADILDALWRLLAPGGKFLYVTCSVFEEENHLQIARFLARCPEARQAPLPVEAATQFSPAHPGQLLPDATHDGFFYALLHKSG